MITEYDIFFDYYKSMHPNEFKYNEVEKGIAYYLKNLQVFDVWKDSKMIANMELSRFKLMDIDAFEMFFEKYEVRYEIETMGRESKILAINRKSTGETIGEETKRAKLEKFYNKTTELLDDERYESWIEYVTNDIIYFLKFASGEVDYLMP